MANRIKGITVEIGGDIRIEKKSLKYFSLEMGFILPPDINNPKGVIEIKSNDLISNVAIYNMRCMKRSCESSASQAYILY